MTQKMKHCSRSQSGIAEGHQLIHQVESEATFNTTSLCDMVLYCSDGEEGKEFLFQLRVGTHILLL